MWHVPAPNGRPIRSIGDWRSARRNADYQGYTYHSIGPLVAVHSNRRASIEPRPYYRFVALTFSSSVSLRFTYQDSIGGPRLQRK